MYILHVFCTNNFIELEYRTGELTQFGSLHLVKIL